MGKNYLTNNKQQKKNNIQRKDKQRGRPPKQNKQPSNSIQKQPIDSKKKQCWFEIDETREIVRILASKCQIIFKCLSGQQANNLKASFWPANQPQDSINNCKHKRQSIAENDNNQSQVTFNNFKHKRQEFVEKATVLQRELLKKLEQHFQIQLIGEKEQMNYFFFGNNTSSDTTVTQETENLIIDLLIPIIHKDFQETLKQLLEFTNQQEIFNLDFQEIDFYDINIHKHFVCWAFVLAWGKSIRDHLTKLQQKFSCINKSNLQKDEISQHLQDTPENLIKKSDSIREIKEQEIHENIDQLIKKYEKEYINEINDLIILLGQRITTKME